MDDSRSSGLHSIRGGPNAATMVRLGTDAPRLPASAIADAWGAIVPPLALIPARDASAPGYRVFWTGGGETGFRDFVPEPGAHLIVGRHSVADVVLGRDAELSLRHLLVLPARAESGAPALRLVDLQGSLPMQLEDGPTSSAETATRSLLAEGPFAVRLGRYVLGGFPIGPAAPMPPADLPRSERIDASSPSAEPVPEAARDGERSVAARDPELASIGGPYRGVADRSRSVITMLPRPITMIESVGSAAVPRDAIGLLGAARANERTRVFVSASDLRAGMLVGRADKCTDGGLKPLLTIRVSRVHAVLIELEGRTMLYDCASTNGTFASGRRVRSLELEPDGPVVQLAGPDGIELRWTPIVR